MTQIEFIQGDLLEELPKLEENSVNVVVTSPPYNIGIDYATYEDTLKRDDYLDWCVTWGRSIKRVLDSEGSLFLNVGAAPANPLAPHQLALRFSEIFTLQNTFHWIKSISVETRRGETISTGHFKPINSKRYVNDCHEYVFHFTRSGKVPLDRRGVGVPYQDKTNIARWGHTGGVDRRCRGNTWFIPYQTIVSRDKERPHPATFPPALAERCVRIHGDPENSTVLDPFAGIGSSALGARAAKAKRFLGFDIDAPYLKVARDRLLEEGDLLL